MKVLKILNNNAFISYDSHNKEVIVMGNGVAFGAKVGKDIAPSGRYKIFSNNNSELLSRLENIVSDIPEEYMKITEQIIFILEKQYDKKINDVVYISLTEHIHGAIERYRRGINLSNPMLIEIKRLFKDEFEIGMSALEDIEREFDIRFNEDEAAYIAQHLIYGQLDYMTSITDMTKLMQEIIDIVKYSYRTDFNEESIYYHRFVTHLKFFVQRVVSGQNYMDENVDLFEIFKLKYAESYECVLKIHQHISTHYNYELNSDEQLYLMIHIEKISQKSRI